MGGVVRSRILSRAIVPALLLVACAGASTARAGTLPFSPMSVWNKPLSATQPLDPTSPGLVAELQRQVAFGSPTINTTRWSVPVYSVPTGQPTVGVTLNVAPTDPDAPALQRVLTAVPIPTGAVPAAGSDGHLVIWQPSTDTMWEFWRASLQPDGWHAGWGGRMTGVSTNPGWFTHRSWGATATGLPLLGGLIRISELQAGHIDHALALAIPMTRYKYPGIFSAPAQKADGNYLSPYAIPEGTRFRLDPTLDLSTLHLPPVTMMLAVAAQRYGVILRDQAGGVAFYGEDPGPTGANPYPSLFGGRTALQIAAAFPWSHLQALPLQIDTTAPDTQITSGPPSVARSTEAAFAFSSTEAQSIFRCSLDGAPWVRCGPTQAYQSLPEGAHVLRVVAADLAWNTDPSPAVWAWRADITPPDTSITSGPSAATSSTTVSFDFVSSEVGSTFECSLDAGPWAACASPVSYDTLAPGDHALGVRATDAAGNVDPSPAAQSFTIDPAAAAGWPDSTPPTTIITAPPPPVTNASAVTVGFIGSESATFQCSVDGGAAASCSSPYTMPGLAEGAHQLDLVATDSAGNVQSVPTTVTFTIDQTPPTTTLDSATSGTISTWRAGVTFHADEPGVTFACRLDADVWAPCTSPANWSQMLDGPHTIQVQATDPAGNVAAPVTTSFTVDTGHPTG